MITTSEQINEVAGSLAKASANFGKLAKTKTANVPLKAGGSYSYKYADLADVVECCRNALAAEGLCIVQGTAPHEYGIEVTTRICHASGQWLQTAAIVPVAKDDAQGIGSAITYGRRYGLTAILGIVADEDDDGAGAVKNAPAQRASAPRTAAKPAAQPAAPQPERPAQPIPATTSHHESWSERRIPFCTALGDLGLKYEDVAAYCDSIRKPRPSAMDESQRRALYGYLESDKGRSALKAFVSSKDDAFPEAHCPNCHAPVEAVIADEVAQMGKCPSCPK